MDGPKGTGKTTLLEAVTQALRADGLKVIRICERKSDPFRAQTMALVNQFVRSPSPDLELAVCERFAQSRAWISQQVLPRQPPSEAAFRRLIPFPEILRLNIASNVRVPDLSVGVVTAPDISWARATARTRGLSSTVMHRFEEHVACTQAFERAVAENGWLLCRNEGTIEDATLQVVSAIQGVLRCP